MNTRSLTHALLAALLLVPAGDLLAQRRTTSGGGSTGRSAPSSGGSGSGGGDRRSTGSSSGSRPGGTSSTGSSTRSRGGDDGGTAARPSSSASGAGSSGATGSGARAAGDNDRPASGKIGAVKATARQVRSRTRSGGGVVYGGGIYLGGCYNCGYWGYYGPRWGWYDGGWWYPARRPPPHARDRGGETDDGLGQGYMPYPYAESDGTGETFVRERTSERHSFGALTARYFSDVGSGTQAGHVALEGAVRQFRGDVEYSHYAEPVVGRTDHLQSLRFSLGAQPALGHRAYLIVGVGARGVFLDDGSNAGGPEGTLGVQVFPVRPIGINVTGRLAGLTWNGQDYFTLRELNTTGSVFLGRVELQAGWHFLKLGGSPAFGGPMIGTRLWF